jgi:cell wall-associated NlpC family hydrolase
MTSFLQARPRALWTRGREALRNLLIAVLLAALLIGTWLASAASAHEPKGLKIKRRHVEKRARKKLGSPYIYGASGPHGFDCSGFTSWVFGGHGASLPHNAAAQFSLGGEGRFRHVWKRGRLNRGDLVFFDTTAARVGHAGIFIGGGRFIHASSSRGVRIDSIWDPYYYGPRFVGAVRVPSLRVKAKQRS